MRTNLSLAAVACGLAMSLTSRSAVALQTDLDDVVEAARLAWLSHDVDVLLAGSDTVRLHLPEIAQALSVRPAQAVRLLQTYLKMAREQTCTLRGVRQLAPDHAYAEMERRYVVRGTAEERAETVYIGFRRVDGVWRLREVRVTP